MRPVIAENSYNIFVKKVVNWYNLFIFYILLKDENSNFDLTNFPSKRRKYHNVMSKFPEILKYVFFVTTQKIPRLNIRND